jgi:hypothetical protein
MHAIAQWLPNGKETLYQLRNLINRRYVVKKVKSDLNLLHIDRFLGRRTIKPSSQHRVVKRTLGDDIVGHSGKTFPIHCIWQFQSHL